MGFKSGFVGVLGQTNVGKSTLINALLGQKALIVSDKPQTTRNRIRCIFNRADAQIVFVDTPGLHQPTDKLSRYLIQQAITALEGLDVLLYLVEPWQRVHPHDQRLFASLQKLEAPRFLLINKVDQARGEQVLKTIAAHAALSLFDEIVPISSVSGHNLDTLIDLIVGKLPEGHPFFEDDQLTDRPLEFVVSELVREQVFHLTHEEIPYSVAVEVDEIVERSDKPLLEIYAFIDVARKSQRGILIGKDGQMIKRIGRQARTQMEALFGTNVFLELKVRVVKKWNQDPGQIERLLGKDA